MTSPTNRRGLVAATPLALGALAAAALLAACGETSGTAAIGGTQRDTQAPTVLIDTLGGAPDSVLAFAIKVTDNLDVARVRVTVSGPVTMAMDTTLAVGTKAAAIPVRLPVPSSIPAGTPVSVRAQATDGAGNAGLQDAMLAVGNVPVPTVTITAPRPGAQLVMGKSSVLSIRATSPMRVRRVGWTATGAFTDADSVVLSSSTQIDSIIVVDTVRVPATANAGIVTITPFVLDSANRRVTGAPLAMSVQATPAQGTAPVVTVSTGSRLEVADSLITEAGDPAGISWVGYEVVGLADTVRIGGDSTRGDGSLVNVAQRMGLTLPAGVPLPLRLRTFAVNASGARGYAKVGAVTRLDTIVPGTTVSLPAGGRVADGIFHPRWDRLYLTNVEKNLLDVFDMGQMRFAPSIRVGSRPWGIAGWPRSRDGTMGDTLLVANSGGTNLSYVDLTSNAEVYRYPLPNLIAYSLGPAVNQAGQTFRQLIKYDFSDRPQFLAATCTGTATTCVDPIVVYSTSPTGGQSLPFPNKGTVRWENLRTRESHFFFEHAVGETQGRSDTLRIVRYAADVQKQQFPSDPDSTVLVEAFERVVRDDGTVGSYSVVVDLPKIGFRDTTFLRNSGNFRRAMLGESGPLLGSRAMMYDATRGLQPSFMDTDGRRWTFQKPLIDLGISPASAVSDVIANTFTFVRGVALNFDGALGAIRADSTYLVDPTLRLQGTLQTSGGQNAGFDFHPQNTGIGGVSPNAGDLTTRLAFSASAQAQFEVYDTWCYRRIATILVRDPIIGPVKASRRSNGQLVVVGATARGVLVLPLTQPLTSSCS